MRRASAVLVLAVLAGVVWNWTRPGGDDGGSERLPPELETTGDVDVFPTPLSFAQFGAKLADVWVGHSYEEDVMGVWRTTRKPLYLVTTLVSPVADRDVVVVGKTPEAAMQNMFDRMPEGLDKRIRSGEMIAIVHAASRVGEARRAPLGRSVVLESGEGLAIGSRVLTPDRLIRAGVLSRSGEVRQEQLAKLFAEGDPRRNALLAGTPLVWTRLQFRQLWVDREGFHLRDQWSLMTRAAIDRHVYRLGVWLQPFLEESLISLVRPQSEQADKSASTTYEFDRLRTALICPAVPDDVKDFLRGIVVKRQVGTDGWIHDAKGRPIELQLQAASLGLMDEDRLAVCDRLYEGEAVEGFAGGVTEETRLEYAAFRKRGDWLDDWFTVNLPAISLRDSRARRFLPRMMATGHPALSDWLREQRRFLHSEPERGTDSSEYLLDACDALRALPTRTFDEDALLCRYTRLLCDNIVRPGPRAANVDWTGGLRAGRLEGVVSYPLTMRMLTHLDWMQSLLKVRGPWPRIEGVVGEASLAVLVSGGPRGIFVGGLFAPLGEMRIHGLVHDVHRPAVTVPEDLPVIVAPGVNQPGAAETLFPWQPFGGVRVEAEGTRLVVRVLTAAGEVRVGRAGKAPGETMVIDPDDPVDALTKGYLRPTSAGPRWVLY